MADSAEAPPGDWTCSRCDVTVSWTAEVERPALPISWIEARGELYCLHCRREMAAEAELAELPDGASSTERQRAGSRGRVEFEIRRVPDRKDNRIAKACNTSTVVVRKARVRLGMQAQAPG